MKNHWKIFLINSLALLGFYTTVQASFICEKSADCLKLALKGIPEAQFRLGFNYSIQAGIPSDGLPQTPQHIELMQKAKTWYIKAASKGNMHAESALGFMYCLGNGVDKSNKQAVYWLKKAAAQGDTSSQSELASIYSGDDCENNSYSQDSYTNPNLSFYWLNKVVSTGNGSANEETSLADNYYYGVGTDVNYDLAFKWYTKALADGGDVENICYMYYFGQGTNRDYSKALNCWKRVNNYNPNYTEALNNIGVMYQLGQGVEQDTPKALAIFNQIINSKFPDNSSTYNIAKIYFLQKKYQKAIPLLESKPSKYISQAHTLLGYMYENGLGTPIDLQKSFSEYKKAAITTSNLANEYKLCLLYYHGKGVSQNFEEAYISCNLAAYSGNDKAALLRDKIINYLTPQQITKLQKRSDLMISSRNAIRKTSFFVYENSLRL